MCCCRLEHYFYCPKLAEQNKESCNTIAYMYHNLCTTWASLIQISFIWTLQLLKQKQEEMMLLQRLGTTIWTWLSDDIGIWISEDLLWSVQVEFSQKRVLIVWNTSSPLWIQGLWFNDTNIKLRWIWYHKKHQEILIPMIQVPYPYP